MLKVTYNYGNRPDQHQAEGLLRMAQGMVILAIITLPLIFFLSIPTIYLFKIGDVPISDNRLGFMLIVIVSAGGLLRVAHRLNTGDLKTAASTFVLMLLATAVLASYPLNPNDAVVMVYSLPVVAAGVLLERRQVIVTAVAALIFISIPVVFDTQSLGISSGSLDPIEVIAYGTIIIAANGIMLYVFAGGRFALLEERLQLTDKLEETLKQVQDLNQGLEQRVQERTRDLEAARLEAERANTVKSQFLASMSHELRTPLNGIINFTGFVADGMLGEVNEKQAEILKESIKSADHLLALINDVLDISKIESGSLRLFVEDNVDLKEEINTVFMTAKGLIADKPVEIVKDIDPELPLIRGDKRRLRQVMLNIVSNACKFTDEGGIVISAHCKEGEIVFAVKDTGPGIKPEDFDNVFETFRQTETGLRNGSGTGLGMPISRRLAEAHGGRLWLDSVYGQGSTFYVAIPLQSNLVKTTL